MPASIQHITRVNLPQEKTVEVSKVDGGVWRIRLGGKDRAVVAEMQVADAVAIPLADAIERVIPVEPEKAGDMELLDVFQIEDGGSLCLEIYKSGGNISIVPEDGQIMRLSPATASALSTAIYRHSVKDGGLKITAPELGQDRA